MSRMHFIPGKAWSYPSDSRRPTMRTFYPKGNVPVCGRAPFGDGTDDPDLVTCSTCRKNMLKGRYDDEATIDVVLTRGAAPEDVCGEVDDELDYETDEPQPPCARSKGHLGFHKDAVGREWPWPGPCHAQKPGGPYGVFVCTEGSHHEGPHIAKSFIEIGRWDRTDSAKP